MTSVNEVPVIGTSNPMAALPGMTATPRPATADMKLEVLVLSVSDVDRAKDFYVKLGWRLDGDFALTQDFRVVQMTSPGSHCSVIFGKGITSAPPGSSQGTRLVVSDLVTARAEIAARGVAVSPVFHLTPAGPVSGPDPDHGSYASLASFQDPDGNGWLLQEIRTRLPGREDADRAFSSAGALADALRRAAVAHGQHQAKTGQTDANWPDWYADFLTREAPSGANAPPPAKAGEMKLEAVVLPVADADRSRSFYAGLGWRFDGDFARGQSVRAIQMTPPGSPCSIIFGTGVTSAVPGASQGLQLVVSDIEAVRADLVSRGVRVSEVFHDAGGVFHHAGTAARVAGPDPTHRSYGTFAAFEDPDGNGWMLQEVTARLPGRVVGETTYGSSRELSAALRRAGAAHGKHEARIGVADANWAGWYADYMVREQSGKELPS